MLKKLDDRQGGFTIVEVMIVLAIAGLILAVVFIAVPALQRNSRNTARSGDLALLRAGFDRAIANNSGKTPSGSQFTGTVVADELNWLGKDKAGTTFQPPVIHAADLGAAATWDEINYMPSAYDLDGNTVTVADNGVGVFPTRQCADLTIVTNTLTAVGAASGIRTDSAWVYLPEGETTLVCLD